MNSKSMATSGTLLATLLLAAAPTAFAATQTLGSGFAQPYAMQLDAAGNLYVADTGNDAVKFATAADGYATITPLGGGFSQPKAIALDASGNVYVADSGNNAIAKMAPNCTSSACVTHLGGGFSGPNGVAVDATGVVYVADTFNGAVKKIPPGCASAGCVQTVVSAFAVPTGISVDPHGNIYFADQIANDATHSGVFEIRASDNALIGIADDNYALSAPVAVVADAAGNVYVSDKAGLLNIIFAVNGSIPATGSVQYAATEDFSGAGNGPRGVTLDANGNIYVADTANDAVKEILSVPVTQRSALLALYLSTGGDTWSQSDNWCAGNCPASGVPDFNAYETECFWYGVFCNANGTQVQALGLNENNLAGTLPPLQAFGQITALNFSGNALSGSLPSFRGLPLLAFANFDTNRLTGSLPDLSGLTQLTDISVRSNQLSGGLPDFAGLPQLQAFDATHNLLSGPLPSFDNLPNLQFFAVGDNQLTGLLPTAASLSRSVQVLYFDHNQFYGPMPDLTGLPDLVGVSFDRNQLSGTLSSLTGLSNLSYFSANLNRFTGQVPSLAGLVNLDSFDVDSNQLSGPVPSLAGLTLLRYVSFSGNQLSGVFPDLTGTPTLAYLDLSSNLLSGPLPADLSAEPNLYSLHVHNNRFTGGLPVPGPGLELHHSTFCPNPLTLEPSANDAAWEAATGQTPWWGPAGGGCDSVSRGDFEQLSNASFEHGITGWHIGIGTCLWQTASEGVFSADFGRWPAPAAVDGDYVLVSDAEDVGVCTLYQDTTVPSDAGHANLSAAVGYNITSGDPVGCSVAVSVETPAGAPVSSYVELSGGLNIPLTQYAPVDFAVHPGDVLRVQITIANLCNAYPTGIVLDNVQLGFLP